MHDLSKMRFIGNVGSVEFYQRGRLAIMRCVRPAPILRPGAPPVWVGDSGPSEKYVGVSFKVIDIFRRFKEQGYDCFIRLEFLGTNPRIEEIPFDEREPSNGREFDTVYLPWDDKYGYGGCYYYHSQYLGHNLNGDDLEVDPI